MISLSVSAYNLIYSKIIHLITKFGLDDLTDDDVNVISNKCLYDLKAFSEKDPSAHNDDRYIIMSYTSYYSVLCYRIAHHAYSLGFLVKAKKLSEYAKNKTGIEIHPACKIGDRFVIDHGFGTVIGETVTIGDDCYILQCVVLGSRYIANNKTEKRHPQLGNNVEVGGFAKLLGPISIGDNVKISPNAIIRESVPKDSKVIISTINQIIKNTVKPCLSL